MGIYAMAVPYILSTYQFPTEFEVEVEETEVKEHVWRDLSYILHKSQIFLKILFVYNSNANF